MKTHTSICTLGLALAFTLNPHLVQAASHCKGLEQTICGTSAACKWNPERKVGDLTKRGEPSKTGARAHCRLDIAAASKLAADINAKK